MAVTRRRSRRDEETEERDERPTRRRRDEDEQEEREERPRRRSSRDEEPEEDERPRRGRRSRDEDEGGDERPRRGRSRSSRDEEPEEDERPRRRRGRGGDDEGGSRRRRGSAGFGAYSAKKRVSGDFAKEFKPGENKKVLIKMLEEGPFASFHQHWIEPSDLPRGVTRRSYVCLDDEDNFEGQSKYLNEEGEIECPLCQIGEDARTFALFNILNLANPRKPEVQVWAAPPTVADMFERAADEKKTSPLNREDVYFEVELQVKGKSQKKWNVVPVKGRDLWDDYEVEPLEADELEDYSNDLYEDIAAVTKVDTYDDLADLADEIMG